MTRRKIKVHQAGVLDADGLQHCVRCKCILHDPKRHGSGSWRPGAMVKSTTGWGMSVIPAEEAERLPRCGRGSPVAWIVGSPEWREAWLRAIQEAQARTGGDGIGPQPPA